MTFKKVFLMLLVENKVFFIEMINKKKREICMKYIIKCSKLYMKCKKETKVMKMTKFNGIYDELTDLVGEKITEILYQQYKGMKINFPSRLLSRDYQKEYIRDHMDTMSMRELAFETGYSERNIQRIIKEIRSEKALVNNH